MEFGADFGPFSGEDGWGWGIFTPDFLRRVERDACGLVRMLMANGLLDL